MENVLKYETRIIAYVDILGFKEIIKQSEFNFEKIRVINDVLGFLKNKETASERNLRLIEIERDAQYKGIDSFDISEDISCTCFSDLIVVSVKVISTKLNEALSTLIANLSFIGAKLMLNGILVRGSITIGNLIHSSSGIIMGQALIDAYELEYKSAKYPRIILSDKLIKLLNYPLENKRDRYPYHQYISRFQDGCVGFHQMIYYQVIQSSSEMSDDELRNELRSVKSIIISGLDASFENPEIYNKYEWLKIQYDELIIFSTNAKEKLYSLNENISGNNIHFSSTDSFHKQ